MTFTDAQREAILSRGGSVLVSAGAGSGKTRVITERLMEYIDPSDSNTEPEEIDRFLVITFTRAAASELKGRIADAISARLSRNPSNRHLRRQLLLCRNARIGTIHSFCGQLLREHAELAGISPAFRVLEEEKSQKLLEAALERVLERRYAEGEEAFLHLADGVGAGRDDSRLAGAVLKLYRSAQSHARPDAWLSAQAGAEEAQWKDISETPWGRELTEELRSTVGFWAGRMEDCLSRMQEDPVLTRIYGDSFGVTAEALRDLEKAFAEGWDAAYAHFPVPFPRVGSPRAEHDRGLAEELKATRKQCADEMKRLGGKYFTASSAELLELFRRTAPDRQMLVALCGDLETEFRRAKQRMNALDFSDLEHRSYALLTEGDGGRSALAEELAAGFREIMVDEYQDVSRVQDAIFHAVSREGTNLFFVGDVKQAIYRFRLADPTIFTEKSRRYAADPEHGGRLIQLQENFRSRPEILDAVNDVFLRCMSERLGELDYRERDCLRPGREVADRGPKPELLLLPREETDGDALRDEAALAGRRILELMQDCRITDDSATEGGTRPLRFGDIAVLLRSANADGGTFRRVFSSMGIPVSAGAGEDFYSSMEVSTVFSMLSLVDNPHRDIPLLTVLRSPAFGFSPDRLSLIRALSPDSDFYTALGKADEPDAKRFLELLGGLRAAAVDLDPVRMVDRITEELELYPICSAMPDAENRLRHLTDLSLMAERFLDSGERGLHRFVLWFENMRSRGTDPGTGGESGDAVQILSIHKSKGLEFPVVFVCGLGKQFNSADTREPILIHPRLGLGPKYSDTGLGIECPTLARRAIARALTGEMKSEELRLLYVAMTRAKERLVMTACLRKAQEQLEGARTPAELNKIPAELLLSAQTPVRWLLPSAAAGVHIDVRICTPETEEQSEEERETSVSSEASPELLRELETNLSWRYPFSAAEELPSKLTATELKDRAELDPDGAALFQEKRYRGSFRTPEPDRIPLSAADRGTATHLVLQQIDFSKTGSTAEIASEIRRLREGEFLSPEEAASVKPETVLHFFSSELGRRLLASDCREREFRFSLLCEGTELLGVGSEGEKILLQGAVDCFFEEEGGLVVIDYKTDRIPDGKTLDEKTERYRRQLAVYAAALRRITGKPVKERYLYYLSSELCVPV